MRIQFGTGQVYFVPLTGGNPSVPSTPRLPGSIQDFNFENSSTIKELRSQNQYPDDTAASDKKATWKIGAGRFDIDLFNNLFAGETASTGGEAIIIQESGTILSTSPYTVTVVHNTGYSKDMGVSFSATGQPLVRITSGTPTTGQYKVNTTTGVYTFAAADLGLGVLISYSYTVTSGSIVTVTNHPQGWAPQFEIYVAETYQELTSNIPNYIHLYACKCTKFGHPLKRADYLICDLEGEAYANAAGNVFQLYED